MAPAYIFKIFSYNKSECGQHTKDRQILENRVKYRAYMWENVMKRIKDIYQRITGITAGFNEHHVGAYAAQTAYFFMLCMIPIILLLITMVQYTPVTKADVMTAVIQVFPSSVESLITSIVNQVYNQSMGIIPVTILVAMWSAGKGVLAMASGLNCIYHCRETRNYIVLRIRATIYTLLFIVVIILLLVLSVFGNTLNLFIAEHIPLLRHVADQLIEARAVIPLSSQPEGAVQRSASGGYVRGGRMDGHIMGVFRLSGYFQRIFQYVREPDHHRTDYVVDVFLYVLHTDWRRTEHADGRQDI